jgi:hypothetical protein
VGACARAWESLQFLAHFNAAHRDEFVWRVGPEQTRPTPSTDERVMAIYPDRYRVRWMPLRIAPDTLDADTLNMTLTLRDDPSNLPFDPHKPRPQPQEDPPPPSDQDTVAASPTWLFSLVAETNGWLAAPPGPTVSMLAA